MHINSTDVSTENNEKKGERRGKKTHLHNLNHLYVRKEILICRRLIVCSPTPPASLVLKLTAQLL